MPSYTWTKALHMNTEPYPGTNMLCNVTSLESLSLPAPSSHLPLYWSTSIHTAPLITAPSLCNPLRSSLSSHYSTKTAHQGPRASLETPFLVPLEGHLIQILSAPHLSATFFWKTPLPWDPGYHTSLVLLFHWLLLLGDLW